MLREKKATPLAFRVVRGLLVAVAAVYLLIVGYVWYAQAKFLFHPRPTVDTTPAASGVKFEDVALPLGSGQLTGWWIPTADPQPKTLLYLHGNAGNIAVNLDQALRLRGVGLNVFLIDYRGYGRSTGGPPREKLLYEDAERAWTWLVSERNLRPADIAIYGHSLGGAVAIDLASRHPDAGALITECTLTSIAERADTTAFGKYLPVRLILTERFDSLRKIGSVRVPKLFLQGDADNMALPVMARRLYDAARDPKQLAMIPGGGHEDSAVANAPAYFGALNGFLAQYGFRTVSSPAGAQ